MKQQGQRLKDKGMLGIFKDYRTCVTILEWELDRKWKAKSYIVLYILLRKIGANGFEEFHDLI